MAPRGRAAGTLPLPHIVVFLGIRDRPGLDAMIAAQQDPRSPRFRRWLDPTEIADRFGPRREHYERVRRWFVDRGFGVVADSPYRIALALEGNAQLVADALGAPIGVFRYRGQLYHAPLAEPALPADLGCAACSASTTCRRSILWCASPTGAWPWRRTTSPRRTR